MTLENQNNEEHKLTKPENLYQEETPVEAAPENIEADIETQTEQLESKQETFEANLEAVGGQEGAEKVWSEMDETSKEKITTKISNYIQESKFHNSMSKDALMISGFGATFTALGVLGILFPQAFPGGEVNGLSGMDRSELASMGIGAVGALMTAVGSLGAIKEKISSIKSAIGARREKKNLQKLEAQYQ